MTYGNESHAASIIRRGSKCIFIVQDSVFITMLEGAILYLFGIQTSRETSHIPSKAQPVGTVVAGHPKSPLSKRLKILLLIPDTFTALTGELGDRQTDRKHHGLASQLECICHQFPGLLCYLLEKNIKTTAETLFLNSSVENISDDLCSCLNPFQLQQQHIINWMDYKHTYFKYFWRK